MCKLAHVIRYNILSQNFHFCCFRVIAYNMTVKLSAVLSILSVVMASEVHRGKEDGGCQDILSQFLSLQYWLFMFLTETRNTVSVCVLPFLLKPSPKRSVRSGRMERMTVLNMLFVEIKVRRQILCFCRTC